MIFGMDTLNIALHDQINLNVPQIFWIRVRLELILNSPGILPRLNTFNIAKILDHIFKTFFVRYVPRNVDSWNSKRITQVFYRKDLVGYYLNYGIGLRGKISEP